MTTPAAGYPDWQRLNTRVAKSLPAMTATVSGSGTFDSGIVYVANFETLLLMALPGASNSPVWAFTVTWYNDAAGTQQVTSFSGAFGEVAGTGVFPLTVLAPYARIQVQAGTPAPIGSYQLYVIPSTNTVNKGYPGSTQLITVPGTSIGAGASITQYAAPNITQLGLLSTWSLSPIWKVELLYNAGLPGVISFYFNQFNAAGGNSVQVGIPPFPVRMVITNMDTASHTFHASLQTVP